MPFIIDAYRAGPGHWCVRDGDWFTSCDDGIESALCLVDGTTSTKSIERY